MKKLLRNYIDTFSGLSQEVWWLALITFTNRAGAMVIPFLSLYMREDLKFTLIEVGWVMTCYGLGSLLGAWAGGKLCDLIGYYKVIMGSLLLTGVAFLAVQFIQDFWGMCIGFFLLIAIADAARPAFFVALSAYSKPENKTRSLTLIRLAINLGFSAGPAVGGIIIATIGYNGLFWVDGITCILAGLLMAQTLNPKRARVSDHEIVPVNPLPPHKDHIYILFLLALVIFMFIFVQYFSTLPLYYKEVHALSEQQIGLLLALNGAIIFLFEMPLIAILEARRTSAVTNVIFGMLITGASFMMLLFMPWAGILVMGMIMATLGEMVAFPYSNAFALFRSKKGRQGAYMGFYSMAFSIAHIFGHNSGMRLIEGFGYNTTWVVMFLLSVVGFGLLLYVRHRLRVEKIG